MRKLLSLLTAILFATSLWATDASMSGGSSVTVNSKSAIKVGASKNGGSMTITVGANATSLSFYIAAWSGDNTSVSVGPTANVGTTALSPTQDSGISGSGSSFTLNGTESTYFTTITLSNITTETEITLSCSAGKNRFVVWGATYETSGGGDTPTPTISADPSAVTNVVAAGVTNQTIDLTYENFTGDIVADATVHPNADGTGTLSPAWLSASVSDADDYATLTYSVDANEGAARTAYIKVAVLDEESNAKEIIIPVSQVKYSAPTGTFNKFTSTTLTEGDYVITYNTNTLKSKVSSNRWVNGPSITSNATSIENPEDSIIWHISASGNYWLLYNAAVEQYAAGTNTKNQGSLVDMPQAGASDLMKWTATYNNSTWEFENYGRSQASSDSGNKWLRNNGNNGWATYASGTGGALTLYKKATTPKAVTIDDAIENGEVNVTGAADLSAVAEGTELTLSNTPDDGYKLTAYDVYKTGESTTKVTVTNNKFTMPDYAVTVSASFEPTKTLSSITLSGTHRTTFWQGETFSSEGLVVTAHYEDESSATVTPASITGYDLSEAGNQTVTVSYTEGTEKTATYDITVKAVPNTKEAAYTVAEAKDIIDKLSTASNVYVAGIISQVDSYNSTYNSITYWISADGTTAGQFKVYGGLIGSATTALGKEAFSAKEDLKVGDIVKVSGTIMKFGSDYEFDKNNEIVEFERPVVPSISLDPTSVSVAATNVENQSVTISAENFNTITTGLYSDEECNTAITSGAWVTDITVNNGKTAVTFNVADNTGSQRQCWLKVTVSDGTKSASAILSITQALYVGPASLPFAFNGAGSDVANTQGMTNNGVGDYNTAPKLKFDNTDDYIIINIASAPAKLAYDIKGNGFSGDGRTFKVQESADGSDYTDVATYTELNSTVANEIKDLSSTTRYVKFIYTKKASGNVALGNIAIVEEDAVYDVEIGTVINGTAKADRDQAIEGQTVTLTLTPVGNRVVSANTVTYNDGVEEQEIDLKALATNQFTMPAANVTVSATFSWPTDIDNTGDEIKAIKVLRDGQIYILRDGKEYNVMGIMVK